jgi:hypothetical protein
MSMSFVTWLCSAPYVYRQRSFCENLALARRAQDNYDGELLSFAPAMALDVMILKPLAITHRTGFKYQVELQAISASGGLYS